MDENKEFEKDLQETANEVLEEVAEEVAEVEETVEAAEEAAEEAIEEVAEEIGEAAEDVQAKAAEVFEAPKKKRPVAAIVIAAVILLLAVFCVLLGMNKFPQIYNKYNHMGYVNITGRTLQDIADESDMELSELLEQYGLPADMPGNTQESAAYYAMPVESIASMYGMTFDELKELLAFDATVTEDTAWGKAEGEVTLEKYIGEDNLESFKEEYGFGDEVTLETKWKEVRKTVDLKAKENYEAQYEESEEPEGFEEEVEETEELEEDGEAVTEDAE